MNNEIVHYFDFKKNKKEEPHTLIFRNVHFIKVPLHCYTLSSSVEIPEDKWDEIMKSIISIITK